jgi:hypothetical protein
MAVATAPLWLAGLDHHFERNATRWQKAIGNWNAFYTVMIVFAQANRIQGRRPVPSEPSP